MPAMAALGRMRRRVAAAAFCQFICCGVSPALADLPRLGRAFALVVRSLEESPGFQVRCPGCPHILGFHSNSCLGFRAAI
jgi:hypothetical protein